MQGILVILFFIGMCGDAYTTFSGILSGLGNQIGNVQDMQNYIFPTIGTSVITGLNLFTVDLFERSKQKEQRGIKIIFLLWFLAILVDFLTSWMGSTNFIKEEANFFTANFLVFFITIFITSSPALLRYIIKNPIY